MTTTTTLSPYPLSPPVNLRDLGGIPLRHGVVRPNFAWRADDISLADRESAQVFVDKNLTSIIDLRSPAEIENTGRGPIGLQPINYHHVPLFAHLGDAVKTGGRKQKHNDLGPLYINLYEGSARQIVTSLSIMGTTAGTTVFHCAAGKDRTGVLAAALLLVLGAEPEAILADYALTGDNSAAIAERTYPALGPLMARMGASLEPAAQAASRPQFSTRPMEELLNHIASTYPDPLEPLYSAGLDDSLMTRLRERGISTDVV